MSSPTYADDDRNHVDAYIYYPRTWTGLGDRDSFPGTTNWGTAPSEYVWASEDNAEGRDSTIQAALLRHGNSISMAGPPASDVGGEWAKPDSTASAIFIHEFQHALNSNRGDTELLSAVAEALAGELYARAQWDDEYTKFNSYAARRSFGAYMVYNMRGMNTSFGGRSDDLVWRWSRSGDLTREGLGPLLEGTSCLTCSTRFQGLTPYERYRRLVQDWRVASFANAPLLEGGRYGFPTEQGFVPWRDAGSWTDNDGVLSNNGFSVPPELVVDESWRRLRWFSFRPGGPGFGYRGLTPEAEVFVFRADPSLDGAKSLVLSVRSEFQEHSFSVDPSTCTGTLFLEPVDLLISAILYSALDDSLFAHPELVTAVVNARVTPDDARSGRELVIPGFGSGTKAAVLIVTGNAQHRLSARLRPVSYTTPVRLVRTIGHDDDTPAWSPGSDTLAYVTRRPASATYRQVHRTATAGGTPQAVSPASANQRNPDWSPRRDFIVFEQDAAAEPARSEIWRRDLTTSSSSVLVTGTGSATFPAFQPNGRMIAYVYDPPGSGWEIRKANVDGSGDSLVITVAKQPRSLRWALNGLELWYSLRESRATLPDLTGDTVFVPYRVSRNGGTPIQLKSWTNLHRGVRSVSTHPDTSFAILEQEGRTPVSCDCACSVAIPNIPDDAIHLRSSATPDRVAVVIDIPRCRQHSPRLAPDGIHLAYSQHDDYNVTPEDRDLWVRKLGDHAPPTFVGAPSTAPFELGPINSFGFDLNATDPEGTAVTFQGVHLPAGSIFNSATGVFTCTAGGPRAYPAFRALDAAGGVATVLPVIDPPVPPNAVGEFAPDIIQPNAIWVAWTAPGDDGAIGTAAEYDIRWSLSPITAGNWSGAYAISGEPTPLASGEWQTCAVPNLQPFTYYYIGIRARDEALNLGPISTIYVRTLQGGGGGGGAAAVHTGGRVEAAGATRVSPGEHGAAAIAGPSLVLEIETYAGEPSLRLIRGSEGASASESIRVESRNADGSWAERFRVQPDGGQFALTARREGGWRITVPARHEFSRIASRVTAGEGPALELSQAAHSRLGGMDPASDLGAPAVVAGDTVALTYTVTNDPGARAEPWIVLLSNPAAAEPTQSRSATAAAPPVAFALHPSRPNPFRNEVRIGFDLPTSSPLRIEIHDLQGRLVSVIANSTYPAGRHAITWDRRNRSGSLAAPGVYLYSMTAGDFRARRRMIALR